MRGIHSGRAVGGRAGGNHLTSASGAGLLATPSLHRLWDASIAVLTVATASSLVVPDARAADYLVSDETELRDTIDAIIANADPNPVIILENDITISSTPFPPLNKPLTINANGFTLSGTDIAAGGDSPTFPGGATLTTVGIIRGGHATTGDGGTGLVLTDGALVNNGTLRGGNKTGFGGLAGFGGNFTNSTVTNNGLIEGGTDSVDNGGGAGGGAGLVLEGTTLTNNGTIIGGTHAVTGNNADGIFISVNSTIINNGTIRGGPNGSAQGIENASGTTVINNGLIANGNNSTSISLAAAAIIFEGSNNTLELWAGSQIIGSAITVSDSFNDTLRLGGVADGTFDIGAISQNFNIRQYRGFEIFEKTGTSTWTMTGTPPAAPGLASPWDIYAGTMLMSAGSDLGNGPVDVFGGTLAGVGTVGPTTNHAGGAIAPGVNGIGTLTVDGDYTGNGGALAIEAILGDDSSPTDLLLINGNSLLGTGATQVFVTNLGGVGAQTTEGIKVVDVGGGTSDAGVFALGGPAIGGAYTYGLFQNGITDPTDGDWYLRTIAFSPALPTYENYPILLLGTVDLPTLEQRVGNRYWPMLAMGDGDAGSDEYPKNLWARFETAHGHYEGDSTIGTAYDSGRYLVQAGLDGLLADNGAGMVIGGFNAQYAHVDADISSDGGDGSNTTEGWGLGATLTWYGDGGAYVDSQAMVSFLSSDLSADTTGTLVENNDGLGYALSIEVGRRIEVNGMWSVTPQAQLSYSSVDFDDFTDPFDATVSLDDGDSLKGRVGIAVNRNAYGADSRSHLYGVANLTYEFLDGTTVDVAGVDVAFEPDAFGGELGIGGTHEWADGKYAIHAELLGQASFEGSYGFKGTAGLTSRF